MRIEIGSDFTEVAIKRGGVYKNKLVSLSDLLDELSIYRTTNFGLLPRSVRIVESSGNHIVLGLEFEPRNRDLKCRGGEQVIENASCPGGIMFVKLRRDAGGILKYVNSCIYAIRGTRISFPNDRLYHMPFPNVYGDGRICWGRVALGDITALSAVEGMISSFWTNNFNSDLFGATKFGPGYGGPRGNYITYFEYLAENEFVSDWLEPTEFSVNQIATRMLQNKE